MSNQTTQAVTYVNHNQEFYDDFFSSKSTEFLKEKLRVFKINAGKDVNNKRTNKPVLYFTVPMVNTDKPQSFKIKPSDILISSDDDYQTAKSLKLNLDWIREFDRDPKKIMHYCFTNGCDKFVGTKFVSCTHMICDAVYNSLNSSHVALPFQEFLYVNLNSEVVKLNNSITLNIFSEVINSKLSTPYFKLHANGAISIACNGLGLLPGVNIFPIYFNSNDSFDITVNQSLSSTITLAQVNNGTLQIITTNSLDIDGDIGFLSKNNFKAYQVTEPFPAKILNVKIKNFKSETYPIRNKTDRNIETLLYLMGLRPCSLAPGLEYSDFKTEFQQVYETIALWLGFNRMDLLYFSDLTKTKRFLDQFGCCANCKIPFQNCEDQKFHVLSCWDTLCTQCLNISLEKKLCVIDCDHEIPTVISTYDGKKFLDGANIFKPCPDELVDFISRNSNDRVFSYTFSYDSVIDEKKINELIEAYLCTKHDKLSFTWEFTSSFYESPLIKSFALGVFIKDDHRKLDCIVTKPTFMSVDVAMTFLNIFKQENVHALDFKLVDFSKDCDYGKLYDVNNHKTWASYWREYLQSDFGFAFMIRTPSIQGFADLIAKTRTTTAIPWTKNPIHRSSSLYEANKNLKAFFPETFTDIQNLAVKRKHEDEYETFADNFFTTIYGVLSAFDDAKEEEKN